MEQASPNNGGADSWTKRANKKVIIGVIIVVIAVGSLIATQIRGALTYYVTVDELKAEGAEAYGERVRVGGRVMAETIQLDGGNNLSFIIFHDQTSNTLPVRYNGIVPDLFYQDKADVIVEGQWSSADGIFYATNLLAQHPPEFKVAEPGKPHDPVGDRSPSTSP